MIDCYGSKNHSLENLVYINDTLNKIAYNLNLDPIATPYLIPYYYGSVKEDIGVSAFLLLKGGHITIHTFPLRECYFVDVFSVKDFDQVINRKFNLLSISELNSSTEGIVSFIRGNSELLDKISALGISVGSDI